jgi:hypothetical protein
MDEVKEAGACRLSSVTNGAGTVTAIVESNIAQLNSSAMRALFVHEGMAIGPRSSAFRE